MNIEANIHTIVHLGAGLCNQLSSWLSYDPEKIILIEADPERAETLKNGVADSENIIVCCAAVSEFTGKATLHRYNFADVNSLSKPTGLLELFPGLVELDSIDVETVPPSKLFTAFSLDKSEDNWLILDTPGEEMRILRDLQKAKQLESFRYLSLNCGRTPLYEDAVPGTKIVNWLQDEGFELLDTNNDDPDRPGWILRRNNLILRYKKLKDATKNKEEKIIEYENKIDELTKLCNTEANQLSENKLKYENQKAELVNKENFINELAIKNKKLLNQLHTKEQQIQDLEQFKSDLTTQSDEYVQKLKALEIEIEANLKTINNLTNKNKEQTEKNLLAVKKRDNELEEKLVIIKELTQKKQELNAQIKDKDQRIHHILQEQEEKTKLLNEKDILREKESAERKEVQVLNDNYQEQINNLNEELEKLRQQLKAEQQKAENNSLQLQEEQQYRQQLIDQEVLKVEAQLELIKDILIRDKAF